MKLIYYLFLAILFKCNHSPAYQETYREKNQKVIDIEKLSGNYFITEYTSHLEKELKFKKNYNRNSKDYYTLSKFYFGKNNYVDVEDLTEFYDCGNFIMIISEMNIDYLSNDTIILKTKGYYTLASSFESEVKYKVKRFDNGDFQLDLIEVLNNSEKGYHE